MGKLYGWGASVVILGALFKINHYPGADIMLIVGLGTESLIFFFSGFEPPYVEPDWSLVYPELAGMYHVHGEEHRTPTEELDNMLEEAKIGPELMQSLGNGLHKLSDNAAKLSDISDAAVATDEYITSVKGASSSVDELSSTYKQTAQSLARDVGASEEYAQNIKTAASSAAGLSSAYSEASASIRNELSATEEFTGNIREAASTVNNLIENYTRSVDTLARSAEALDLTSLEGRSYNEQLRKISDNLEALNSVYELQLQASNEQVESSVKLQTTLGS
ncbi:MAG: gliding motility protein GldL, partial [Bacteroidota bacterium]|nr:gliding motility protein GldL [Bacteroidota bacterium]